MSKWNLLLCDFHLQITTNGHLRLWMYVSLAITHTHTHTHCGYHLTQSILIITDFGKVEFELHSRTSLWKQGILLAATMLKWPMCKYVCFCVGIILVD